MRAIVLDVATYHDHDREFRRTAELNRDAVCERDSPGSKEPCFRWDPYPHGNGDILERGGRCAYPIAHRKVYRKTRRGMMTKVCAITKVCVAAMRLILPLP